MEKSELLETIVAGTEHILEISKKVLEELGDNVEQSLLTAVHMCLDPGVCVRDLDAAKKLLSTQINVLREHNYQPKHATLMHTVANKFEGDVVQFVDSLRIGLWGVIHPIAEEGKKSVSSECDGGQPMGRPTPTEQGYIRG